MSLPYSSGRVPVLPPNAPVLLANPQQDAVEWERALKAQLLPKEQVCVQEDAELLCGFTVTELIPARTKWLNNHGRQSQKGPGWDSKQTATCFTDMTNARVCSFTNQIHSFKKCQSWLFREGTRFITPTVCLDRCDRKYMSSGLRNAPVCKGTKTGAAKITRWRKPKEPIWTEQQAAATNAKLHLYTSPKHTQTFPAMKNRLFHLLFQSICS